MTKRRCTECYRTEEILLNRARPVVRPIVLDRNGICGACRESAAEARADDDERLAQARALVQKGGGA
jgi:hypothetical protein